MTETNASSARCPRCGQVIPSDASGGVCPRCVMALNLAAPTEFSGAETGGPAAGGQGERPPAPSLEAVAAAFPQLEVEGLIGQGGMGAVFKARQPRLNRNVAVKILPASLACQPAFAERFAREGQLLARLAHPNIVAVHDFGQAGGFFYLIMEYVDGVNLRQALRAGRFSPAQALAIVPKICEALQYAHDEGVFHRDIKPENILLDQKGRVKLADFGIAKLAAAGAVDPTEPGAGPVGGAATAAVPSSLTRPVERLGTPQYMAPEQADRSAEVDHRADIYSLGVVFYELLTGELPGADLVPPSQRASVDPRVDEVVRRALAKERDRRYQSAGEFKTRLDEIVDPVAPPVLPRRASSSRLKVVKVVVIAVLLLIAMMIVVPVGLYLILGARRSEQVAQAARQAEAQARMKAEFARAQAMTQATVSPKGQLRLIAGGPHKNIAIARSESVVGQPLHQVVVRYAGPELPVERWREARTALYGPMLHPSMEEEAGENLRPDPVDNQSLQQLDASLKFSSTWFDCPAECQLEFALPGEPEAAEASRQMNAALAAPVALEAGRRLHLFRVNGHSAWLEVRPHPLKPGFSVTRSTSRSPAFASISNSNVLESALIVIPPRSEFTFKIRTSSSRRSSVRANDFETILSAPVDRPGVYWLAWHPLPDPGVTPPLQPQPRWLLSIHDASNAEEVCRVESGDLEDLRNLPPDSIGWQRRTLADLTNGPANRKFEGVVFTGVTADPQWAWYVTVELAARRR